MDESKVIRPNAHDYLSDRDKVGAASSRDIVAPRWRSYKKKKTKQSNIFDITLFDSYFHRRIINKYQKEKRSPLRFPMMLFYKNARSIFKKIHKQILFQVYFNKSNTVFSSFVKYLQDMRRFFLWPGTQKFISPTLQSILNLNEALGYETVLRLFPVVNTPMNIGVVHSQPLNHLQVLKTRTWSMAIPPTSTGVGSHSHAKSLFDHKSPAILSRVNFLPGNSETPKFWIPLNKPFKINIESNASDSITFWRRAVFDKNSEDFYFHKRQSVEQEVEEIKKIIVETKEAVVEKSQPANFPSEMDIKRHFDINRISDQVYQNIERQIRMEKERRGL